MLYPLSYEGGACLDLGRNRTRLPILAGCWAPSLAGLDLTVLGPERARPLEPCLPARGEAATACIRVSAEPCTTDSAGGRPTHAQTAGVESCSSVAVLRSARSTRRPAARPDMTWVRSVPAFLAVTTARVATPFLSVKATALAVSPVAPISGLTPAPDARERRAR